MRFLIRSFIGVLILSLTFGLLFFAGFYLSDALKARAEKSDKRRYQRERVFAVNVEEVRLTSIAPKIFSYGEATSKRSLQIRSLESGRLDFVSDDFVEGGFVTKGQILFRLDQKDFIDALKETGLNPERIFMTFVNSGGFASLPISEGAHDFLNGLKEKGYWIQILTARPEENLQCLYDTYWWLNQNDIPFDDVAFSSEKFRWCAQSKYYDSDSIAFAIDDSPKHASEYDSQRTSCCRSSYRNP